MKAQVQLPGHTQLLGLCPSLTSPKHPVGSLPPAAMVLNAPRAQDYEGNEGKGWKNKHRNGVEEGGAAALRPLKEGQCCSGSAHLDGPRDAKEAGRDPGFPLDLGPVAVLWVHPVHAALLHHLHEAQPGCGRCPVPALWLRARPLAPTMRRAWLMFQVNVVMVWFLGSTIESSRM